MPDTPSLVITSKTIPTLIGIITLGTLVFTGISIVNSYAYRLDRLEADKIELSSSIDKLADQISTLNDKIVDLTISLNRVQDKTGVKDAQARN